MAQNQINHQLLLLTKTNSTASIPVECQNFLLCGVVNSKAKPGENNSKYPQKMVQNQVTLLLYACGEIKSQFCSPLCLTHFIFKLYMAYVQKDWNYVCYFDGEMWSKPMKLPRKSSKPPQILVYRDELYCLYVAKEGGEICYSTSSDGTKWREELIKTGIRENTAFSAQVFQQKIFLVLRRQSSHVMLWVFDGEKWSEETDLTKVNDTQSSTRPALVSFKNKKLFLCVKGRTINYHFLFSFSHHPGRENIDGLVALSI